MEFQREVEGPWTEGAAEVLRRGGRRGPEFVKYKKKGSFNSLYHQTREGNDFTWSPSLKGFCQHCTAPGGGAVEQRFSILCENSSDVPQGLYTFWGGSVSSWDLGRLVCAGLLAC